MLNYLIRLLSGKEIILYNPHRQINPIIENKENRKKFQFISVMVLWNWIPFKAADKKKYKLMYFLLSIVNPLYVIDINWLTTRESLYKVWTKKHSRSKFIVIQHGSYVGGIVTLPSHRFTKCDVLFTWGEYFTNLFNDFNSGKKTTILSFGNPIYNQFDRSEFSYKTDKINRILITPSGIKGNRLQELYHFYHLLKNLGFEVYIKEHGLQEHRYGKIEGIPKVTGNAREILLKHDFDLLICDHSTILLDAIFFKNPVIFFSAPGAREEFIDNQFTKYLKNIHHNLNLIHTKENLLNFIDIPNQERLFEDMIHLGSNKLAI